MFSFLWSQSNLKHLSESEVLLFADKLKNRSEPIKTLIANFRQEKRLEILNKKMVSYGIFKYKKEDKIAFLYTQPNNYHMIINGDKIKILSSGKMQIIDIKNNPMLREVQNLIAATFLGNISHLKDLYKISYFNNNAEYVIVIIPKSKQLITVISKITIYFDNMNLDIIKIKIDEDSGGTTEYFFDNQKINTDFKNEDF